MPQLRADAREAALTVDDRTDQQDNRTIARRLVMELAQGCGDHSCRFNKPSGMGTNGGCRCIDKIEDALSRRSTVPSSDGLAKFLEDVVHLSERLIDVAPVRPEDFMRSTVTPAEVHKPGESWPGEWCKRCDRRNNVGFSVGDETWSAVVRGRWNVLCPACFDEEAEAAGVRYSFAAPGGELWPVLSWSDWIESNGAGTRIAGRTCPRN
jgi:hypothetical protein